MHLKWIVIKPGFRIWHFYRPVVTGSTGSDFRLLKITDLPYVMHLKWTVFESGIQIWHFYRPVVTGSTGSDVRLTMIVLYPYIMHLKLILIESGFQIRNFHRPATTGSTGSTSAYRKIRDFTILYEPQKIMHLKRFSSLTTLNSIHSTSGSAKKYDNIGSKTHLFTERRWSIFCRNMTEVFGCNCTRSLTIFLSWRLYFFNFWLVFS